MKIAVVLGSTRPGRVGSGVAEWVMSQAASRTNAEYTLVDLKDFDLDLLNEPTVPGAANRRYENPKTRRWSEAVDGYDGFTFVTPEYNHGVPAALKNAFDVLYPEWNHKAIAFVSYGADRGTRAVEQWRGIVANAHMVDVRAQLSFDLFGEFDSENGGFTPYDRRPDEAVSLFDQLERMAAALKPLRD